ncbi:MAG TPA: BON domain-containing protein [Caulifigura sp.]|nr:BON domain-containing protein [Caulifigura sp.]
MLRHTLLIAAAALFTAPSLVQAQSSSLFGNRGVTGSSGTLSNGVGGNRTGGGTGAAGNAGAMQGFTGATAGSQSGFLSGAQSNSGSGLAGAGNTGFVGNRGSSASTQGAAGGANRNAAGRGGLGGLSRGNAGQRNRGNQNRGAASGAQSTPVRPVMVMSFEPPVKTGQNLVTSIQSDLSSAVTQGRLPGIAIEADDQGTVTLNGHVATESDRRKAERLVRLEPGVRNVVNRITVQEPVQ